MSGVEMEERWRERASVNLQHNFLKKLASIADYPNFQFVHYTVMLLSRGFLCLIAFRLLSFFWSNAASRTPPAALLAICSNIPVPVCTERRYQPYTIQVVKQPCWLGPSIAVHELLALAVVKNIGKLVHLEWENYLCLVHWEKCLLPFSFSLLEFAVIGTSILVLLHFSGQYFCR